MKTISIHIHEIDTKDVEGEGTSTTIMCSIDGGTPIAWPFADPGFVVGTDVTVTFTVAEPTEEAAI